MHDVRRDLPKLFAPLFVAALTAGACGTGVLPIGDDTQNQNAGGAAGNTGTGGAVLLCADGGDACQSDGDCCSQLCWLGVCAVSGQGGAGQGGTFNQGGASLVGGAPGSGGATQCANDGDPCSSNGDCCGLVCAGGVCGGGQGGAGQGGGAFFDGGVCALDGQPCFGNADCCGFFCSGGVCGGGQGGASPGDGGLCGPPGAGCIAFGDCCSNVCAGGVCL